MNTELPKQFIPINGKPLLMLTLEAFSRYDNKLELILVLPVSQQEYWHSLCRQHEFALCHKIADGGETRFHSVKNGLAQVPDTTESLVAVHDGVRPFVSQETIAAAFVCAEKNGTAVPVVDSVDSIRTVIERGENFKTIHQCKNFIQIVVRKILAHFRQIFIGALDKSSVQCLNLMLTGKGGAELPG